jgi:uncharacterized membrane protein
MQHAKEFVIGFVLSIASWETWENIFVSLLIAFFGGLLAAAGKALHNRIYARFHKNKRNEED